MSSRFDQRRKYTAVVKPRQRPPVGLRKDLLILFERGMRHQAQGKLDKALECYDAILKLEPNNTDALFMRARALMKAERYREAIDWAKRAAASKPNHPALQFIIAFNYHSLNRPFETIRHLKKALKLQPDYSMARLLLARAYFDAGRINDALTCVDAGVITSETAEEKLTHATVLDRLGRSEAASQILLALIDEDQMVPESLYELVGLTGTYWTAAHRDLIDTMLAESKWSQDQKVSLNFTAGNISDHEGRYDDAFAYFSEGNKADLAAPYDIDAYRQSVRRMIELFSPALFQAKTGFGSASHTPTFVVGLPRAGKTIVEGALSRHPRIHGAGELSLQTLVEGGLIVGLDPDLPAGFEEKIGKLDADEARILADTYLKEIVRYNPKSRFVLNTLPQNFQNIGVLHLLFPNAKFIHVKREPVDNCLFCFMKKFANPHTYSQDLGIMGAYYRCYAELMDHWKSIFPGKIHDVRYEDFVADPAATLNDVLDFLGLDLDPDMRAQTPTAGRGSVRAGHVTEPINESHVAYWRNYERHLAPLFEALGR